MKYLVENSLGRYWIDVLKARGSEKSEKQIADDFDWQYYMSSAPQNKKPDDIKLKDINIQDVTFIDPAMGSGHILVYAFDLLLQIYKSEGYTQKDAARLILCKNLYGLDIDTRAFQLTYFALTMKARNIDRRFFKKGIALNVIDIPESDDSSALFCANLKHNIKGAANIEPLNKLISAFEHGNDLGSIIKFKDIDLFKIENTLNSASNTDDLTIHQAELDHGSTQMHRMLNTAKILTKRFTVSVSNPPYMGAGKMDESLKKYIRKYYPDSKADLFAVFIERMIELTKHSGYIAMITQHSWMFLSSFEKLRKKLQSKTIVNLAHLGTRAFEEIGGEVVQSAAFILKNEKANDYIGTYERLTEFGNSKDKEKNYLNAVKYPDVSYIFRSNQTNFLKVPGSPIVYWTTCIPNLFHNNKLLKDISIIKSGLSTGNNDLYMRYWFEISLLKYPFKSSLKKNMTSKGRNLFP